MKNLIKSAAIVGQVFGLVMGENFTIPSSEILAQYPSLVRFAV